MAAASYSSVHNQSGMVFADPKVWTFFEPPNGVTHWLDERGTLAIRQAEDPTHQCPFFYIGRRHPTANPNLQIKHTVVKFSEYEGKKILHWLEPILDMVEQYNGRDQEVIPYFADVQAAEKRTKDAADSNRILLWQNDVDLQLATVWVKLVKNGVSGKYDLYLLNPVSAEIQEKHKGWPGPCVQIRHLSMFKLRQFIKREIGGFDETDGKQDTEKSG